LPSLLQWSRRVHSAECGQPAHTAELIDCRFNGAAEFTRRNDAAEVLLFGRVDEEAKLNDNGQKVGKTLKRWIWVDKVKEGPAKFRVDLEWDAHSACFISDYDDPRAAGELFDGQDYG